MKRVIAMFAVFALAAAMAIYVALAPNGVAPLDSLAAWVEAMHGRGTAVLMLLGVGLVLAFLVGVLMREEKAGEDGAEQAAPAARRKRGRPRSSHDRDAELDR